MALHIATYQSEILLLLNGIALHLHTLEDVGCSVGHVLVDIEKDEPQCIKDCPRAQRTNKSYTEGERWVYTIMPSYGEH